MRFFDGIVTGEKEHSINCKKAKHCLFHSHATETLRLIFEMNFSLLIWDKIFTINWLSLKDNDHIFQLCKKNKQTQTCRTVYMYIDVIRWMCVCVCVYVDTHCRFSELPFCNQIQGRAEKSIFNVRISENFFVYLCVCCIF